MECPCFVRDFLRFDSIFEVRAVRLGGQILFFRIFTNLLQNIYQPALVNATLSENGSDVEVYVRAASMWATTSVLVGSSKYNGEKAGLIAFCSPEVLALQSMKTTSFVSDNG